ncbi:hypothetical protein [Ruegeria sp. EL01]|jgi:hypothetical protein|uniref:hypothetical protein n=1 Tax=Ruegeria sp. EL01 TaxID=2107578 RepID=UPI000EA7FC01|nr:hypothetical protein [Ruegeria sp. EL01]
MIHRRTLLKSSVPVLTGAVATGALSGEILDPEGETPIQRLFAEWNTLYKEYDRLSDQAEAILNAEKAADNPNAFGVFEDHDQSVVEPVREQVYSLEGQILDQPASDLRDLAMKTCVLTNVSGLIDYDAEEALQADSRRLLNA